eukprot:2160288-Amphidinium_carterae.1
MVSARAGNLHFQKPNSSTLHASPYEEEDDTCLEEGSPWHEPRRPSPSCRIQGALAVQQDAEIEGSKPIN